MSTGHGSQAAYGAVIERITPHSESMNPYHDLPKIRAPPHFFMQGHASDCNSRFSSPEVDVKSDTSLLQHRVQYPSDLTPQAILLHTDTTEDPARSYQPSVFAARCTIGPQPFHWPVRWTGLIELKMEACEQHLLCEPFFHTENLNLLVFASKCVLFSFASNFFPFWQSHRVCLTYLLHVILLLLYCHFCLPAAADQFYHYPQPDSEISRVFRSRSNRRPRQLPVALTLQIR
jgi:hypothetical protein